MHIQVAKWTSNKIDERIVPARQALDSQPSCGSSRPLTRACPGGRHELKKGNPRDVTRGRHGHLFLAANGPGSGRGYKSSARGRRQGAGASLATRTLCTQSSSGDRGDATGAVSARRQPRCRGGALHRLSGECLRGLGTSAGCRVGTQREAGHPSKTVAWSGFRGQ